MIDQLFHLKTDRIVGLGVEECVGEIPVQIGGVDLMLWLLLINNQNVANLRICEVVQFYTQLKLIF